MQELRKPKRLAEMSVDERKALLKKLSDEKKFREFLAERMPERQEAQETSPLQSDEHELFSLSSLQKLKATKISQDHLKDKLKSVHCADRIQRLITPTAEIIADVEVLSVKYPNFGGFIAELVVPQLYLQMRMEQPLHLSPFVLLGAPGIGKTAFLSDLALVLGVGWKIVDANAIQTSGVLNGLTRVYSNSTTGAIFDFMLFDVDAAGQRVPANSIFCIDEVDKVGQNEQLGSTENLLLALLERRTAQRFIDAAVPEFPLNIEHLIWGFTANSVDQMSAPLLSRMTVVDVPSLTFEQSLNVVGTIFNDQAATLKSKGLDVGQLEDHDRCQLAACSPREQIRVLKIAIAQAVHTGSRVRVAGLMNGKQQKKIGFI